MEIKNENIRECFLKGHVPHFITIKPDNKSYLPKSEKLEKLLRYYKNNGIRYWFREVESKRGFRHLHGLIQYPPNNDFKKIYKLSKAIQRYVNRNLGFHTNIPLHSDGDIERVITYIKNQDSNKLLREAFSNSLHIIEPN